jgi:hypothetical protein
VSEKREAGEVTGFEWLRRDRAREVEEPVGETTVPGLPRIGAPPKRRKRKKTGKRSNPDYEQASAYVRKKVYRRVKQALLAQEGKVEYSALVESLLVRWLDEVGWPLEDEEEEASF